MAYQTSPSRQSQVSSPSRSSEPVSPNTRTPLSSTWVRSIPAGVSVGTPTASPRPHLAERVRQHEMVSPTGPPPQRPEDSQMGTA